ncbi:MAG: hypothetical protein GY795_36970 [Desulfobacterales bacterium]|nr:hypothetical protein [Desulfobacterales bacterium]
MANKQIDRSTFNELWEEIRMLNIIKFAHEKGREEGIIEGSLKNQSVLYPGIFLMK